MKKKDDNDPGEWAKRIQAGEEYRDDHLFALKEMIQAAHGPHYVRQGVGRFLPENHYHSYLTLMLPRLIFDNPSYSTKTRRPGSQKYTAEAIRHGLNRWACDIDIREPGLQVAVDMLFNHGWMMVRQIPIPGMKTSEEWIWDKDGTFRVKGDALWPSAYRLSPDSVVMDPNAYCVEQAEWIGHRWSRRFDRMEAEAKAHPDRGWDLAAIRALKTSTETTPDGDPLDLHYDKPDWPARDMVTAYTIWVPGLQLEGEPGPDEGYHGTLLTLGHLGGAHERQTAARWIKKPRPYYGPKKGPYVLFGAYRLPDKLYPLSPLVAVEGQIRELNRHARAWSRSAENHKRVVLYDQKDTKTAAKLRRAQHDFYVGIPGFDKQKFAEAELGGATADQYMAYQFLQERLDRVSSMSEAQRGGTKGIATATEDTIADEASMTRMAFLKQQYTKAMKEVSERAAHFMYYDDRVVFPLGEDAAADLDMEEPWFHGGIHDQESDATFEDLELEIEPFSMERTDQAGMIQKTMTMAEFVIGTAQMIPLMPWVEWDLLYETVGNAMNMPMTVELVDVEAGRNAEPFVQGGEQNQPRLARDVGTSYGQGGGGQPMGGGQKPLQLTQGAGSGNRMKGLAGVVGPVGAP